MKVIRGSELKFEASSHENPNKPGVLKPGVLKRVLATKGDFFPGQTQMVNWAKLPARSSFQPHYHEDMLEVFIMLGGPVEITVQQQSVQLQRGDAVLVEARETHSMTNLTDDDVEFVVFGISTGEGGKTVTVDESIKEN